MQKTRTNKNTTVLFEMTSVRKIQAEVSLQGSLVMGRVAIMDAFHG
jgi:hypothetical protein